MFTRNLTATYNTTTVHFPEPIEWSETPKVVETELLTESGFTKTNFMRDTYQRNIAVTCQVTGTTYKKIKAISLHRSLTITFTDEVGATQTMTARIRDFNGVQYEPSKGLFGGSSIPLYTVSFNIIEF